MSRINRANIKKALYYLKRNGVCNTWYAAKERMEEGKKTPYSYIPPTKEELEKQRKNPPAYQGVISVVVPTYHTSEQYMKELIEGLRNQTYPNWELILADATEDDSVKKVVSVYSDHRIRYISLAENGGISQNTNQGLEQATGEYVGLLDHDDVLTPDALYEVAVRIGQGAKMIYSDEDKCNSDGTEFYEPNRKEKFNLDLLLSNNYICHFLVLESRFIKELKFRPEYDGAQDYDLVLRAVEKLLGEEEHILHIPKVLYHWRCHGGSTAENPQSKQYAYEAGLRALQDFANRQNWNAVAVHLKHLGFYKLTYPSEKTGVIIDAILKERKDLGAVGGRVLHRGKLLGGRMTEDGEVLNEGLPAAYSGELHRAVLTQNADAVDIRCICVRKECVPIFEKITGVTYKEDTDTGLFDVTCLPGGTDYQTMSLALGKALREAGYRILYEPNIAVKL